MSRKEQVFCWQHQRSRRALGFCCRRAFDARGHHDAEVNRYRSSNRGPVLVEQLQRNDRQIALDDVAAIERRRQQTGRRVGHAAQSECHLLRLCPSDLLQPLDRTEIARADIAFAVKDPRAEPVPQIRRRSLEHEINQQRKPYRRRCQHRRFGWREVTQSGSSTKLTVATPCPAGSMLMVISLSVANLHFTCSASNDTSSPSTSATRSGGRISIV